MTGIQGKFSNEKEIFICQEAFSLIVVIHTAKKFFSCTGGNQIVASPEEKLSPPPLSTQGISRVTGTCWRVSGHRPPLRLFSPKVRITKSLTVILFKKISNYS